MSKRKQRYKAECPECGKMVSALYEVPKLAAHPTANPIVCEECAERLAPKAKRNLLEGLVTG